MFNSLKFSPLFKQSSFSFSPRSIAIFIVACVLAWALNMVGQFFIPSQNIQPYFIRAAITLIAVSALIILSIRLLRQNHLPAGMLRLNLTGTSVFNLLLGSGIGMAFMVFFGILLCVFIPYHFVAGPLKYSDVLKESYAYFLGNMLEELMFRGFLLIILCQLIGWRKAVWIMALLFGMFHLQWMGFSMAGLKMVITTAAFSFTFSYSFLLTGSLWAAVGVHVSANILLHAVTGLDGANRAMFIPVFNTRWPENYDAGFLVMLVAMVSVAVPLFFMVRALSKKHDPSPRRLS